MPLGYSSHRFFNKQTRIVSLNKDVEERLRINREKPGDLISQSDIECHMFTHAKTSGKAFGEVLSEEEAYFITHSLMYVKVYLYSLVNMSSEFFRGNDTTPATVNGQMTELIEVVESVKKIIGKCGIG